MEKEKSIFSDEVVEQLARILHDKWMEEKIKQGWKPGPKKDPVNKTHPNLVPYDELPEEIKELDRMYARNLLKILENSGFKPVSSKDEPVIDYSYLNSPNIKEQLSEAAHNLWLEEKKQKGQTDDPYYKPYSELPEEAKQLNRNTVEILLNALQETGVLLTFNKDFFEKMDVENVRKNKNGNIFSQTQTPTQTPTTTNKKTKPK